MKHQQWGLYAIALAIVVVGLVALGVPAWTLPIAALVLVCPVMMFFMMRGMRGDNTSGGDRHDEAEHDRAHPGGEQDQAQHR